MQAERTARWLFVCAAAAALFACVDFVYRLPAPARFAPQFIWLSTGVYRRAQGFFYDASALGNLCAFFLIMSVGSLITGKLLPKFVAAGGIAVFFAALLLSFSRAAMGAAFIGLLVLAALEDKAPRRFLAAAALAGATAAAFLLAMPEAAFAYFSRLYVGHGVAATPARFFSGRLETWSVIAHFVAHHPWQCLAGIGYKTLPYTRLLGRPVIADNMYLSTLVETGIFGLAALTALNICILKTSFASATRGSFLGKCMFCFWIGAMFQMLAEDVLTFWRVLPIYFWVLAQIANEDTADRPVR